MTFKDKAACPSHGHHDAKYEDAIDHAIPLLGILAILGGVAISVPILMKLSLVGGAACLCMLFSSMALVKRYYVIGGIGLFINMLVLIYEIANPMMPVSVNAANEYMPHECRFAHDKMAKEHGMPGMPAPIGKMATKPAKPAVTK